ncbi:hypothetical protein ACP93_18095 [Xanthomonas sp. NCPPB 1128]|uniref:DUF6414 family protein n=1 Tax=Xanthomonas sp. NCPPB 1128 TaxID=1775876 RepID=UPI00065AC926|nr:hypothetical protein [Xanthomonas sp. NCPPB 1128]KMM74140.1 hypothetical protein ACP93_18095 [Xanthomonas sp. NCPPB 1128]
MKIRDFLYVDTDKAISVYSQLTGGVVDVREHTSSRTSNFDNKRHYDFRIFKHDAGGSSTRGDSQKAIVKPHHALLAELEDELREAGHLLDLTEHKTTKNLSDPEFRTHLKNSFCIKATGRAVIEDYKRIKKISETFPQITAFINRCIVENSEINHIKQQIIESEKSIALISDRNLRAAKNAEIRNLKESFKNALIANQVGKVDQWLLDGVSTWIETYLPEIINIRIYPSLNNTAEHVFGSLKRHCVEVGDLDYFHYAYGSLPTEQLTIMGIVTSVPDPNGETFDPLAEFDKIEQKESEVFEAGFRRLFRGFDGLEAMIRTAHYPRILVYPIVVYREVSPNNQLKEKG